MLTLFWNIPFNMIHIYARSTNARVKVENRNTPRFSERSVLQVSLLFILALAACLLVTSALFFSLRPMSVAAQSSDDPQTGTAVQDVTANDVNEVAQELWCPLCSGVRLDACELKACDQMKEMIAIQLSEGATVEEIKTYFLGQYGPQVLGEPPREGFNWLAWIMPFAVLLAGGGFLWYRAQHMFSSAEELEAALAGEGKPGADQDDGKSDYERKLEEELTRYG